MLTLGITAFWHDASATLVNDGIVIAAAEEERFTRQKHDGAFPHNAINFCLKRAGISLSDLDYVVFSRNPHFNLHKQFSHLLRYFPKSLASLKHQDDWIAEWWKMFGWKREFRKAVNAPNNLNGEFLTVEHALSHAGSAFLPSPFDEALILVYDAIGEWASTTIFHGNGTEIDALDEIHFPHSLGVLYQTVTMFLGFTIRNDEYKVMGLSSYGEPRYLEQFRDIVQLKPDGKYEFDLSYFRYHFGAKPYYSQKFIDIFGEPRQPGEPITKRHEDIANSLQRYFEEIVLHLVNNYQEKTGAKHLCIAGGVGLNSVLNGVLLTKSNFDNIFIQPAAGDAGGSLGAALYVDHQRRGNRKFQMKNAYLGPEFTAEEIEKALSESQQILKKCEASKVENPANVAAKFISDGKIVGWFQGRMEFGPRALGCRSILADARRPEMKDILNRRVKGREPFRPFAPSVLAEKAMEYFEMPSSDFPFMLFVFPVKADKREKIPAVTHVDHTARIQTVSRKTNPLYWQLIKEYEKLTGIPVILNTSFNRKGEPIVCTPKDAINCFFRTNLDALIIGNFLLENQENKSL